MEMFGYNKEHTNKLSLLKDFQLVHRPETFDQMHILKFHCSSR